MSTSTPSSASASLGKRAIAFVVLLVAAWLLLKFIIGLIAGLATLIVVVLAVAAVIWAIRVL